MPPIGITISAITIKFVLINRPRHIKPACVHVSLNVDYIYFILFLSNDVVRKSLKLFIFIIFENKNNNKLKTPFFGSQLKSIPTWFYPLLLKVKVTF